MLVDPNKYERFLSLEKQLKSQEPAKKDTTIFSHPNVERVHELDNEMRVVLNDTSVSDFDKAMQYGEKLQSYLNNYRTALTTPKTDALIGTLSKKTETTDGVQSAEEKKETFSTFDKILSNVPKSYLSKGRRLVDFLRNNTNIKLDNDGRIVYKGEILRNSNIVTVVDDLIRVRKPRSDAEVIDVFRDVLAAEGYPMTALAKKFNKRKATALAISVKQKKSPKTLTNKPRTEIRNKIPISENKKSPLLAKWKSAS